MLALDSDVCPASVACPVAPFHTYTFPNGLVLCTTFFRARDFAFFNVLGGPWSCVCTIKGFSCDMGERERMSGFGLGARCAAPSCRVWSVELPVARLVWKI